MEIRRSQISRAQGANFSMDHLPVLPRRVVIATSTISELTLGGRMVVIRRRLGRRPQRRHWRSRAHQRSQPFPAASKPPVQSLTPQSAPSRRYLRPNSVRWDASARFPARNFLVGTSTSAAMSRSRATIVPKGAIDLTGSEVLSPESRSPQI